MERDLMSLRVSHHRPEFVLLTATQPLCPRNQYLLSVHYLIITHRNLFDFKNNQLKLNTVHITTGFMYRSKITPLCFLCQDCGFQFL